MATDTINALGAGSGIDVKTLATSLVDAERVPKKALIDKGIAKSEAQISGYSAIKFVLGELKTSFGNLKDLSDFNTMTVGNSQPAAFTATAGAKAVAAMHAVEVLDLAQGQRSASGSFSDAQASLTQTSGGAAFSVVLGGAGFPPAADGTPVTIAISPADDSPAGVVGAINRAGLGLSAQLVKTSESPVSFQILVSGLLGAGKAFSLTAQDSNGASLPSLSFGQPLQAAQNARVKVNGLEITAASNKLEDAIPGVTLNLSSKTTPAQAASLNLTRDTAPIKSRLEALVTSFNDVQSLLDEVSNPASTMELYGATLVGNSTVSQVRAQVRDLMVTESNTPSGEVKALRHLGISITREGKLELDSGKLDTALAGKFDDAVTMLSGRKENFSIYSEAPAGTANKAFNKITAMIAATGTLSTHSANAAKRIDQYKEDLAKLEVRMTSVLERYTRQFGAMESIVGQSKSLRTSLTSTFEGMMAAYTNK